MSKTLSASAAFTQVQKSAEKIKNDELAVVGTVSCGDVVRQGDLYLVCITGQHARIPPASLKLTEQRQLAPGATQGSRHLASGNCLVYNPEDRDAVIAAIVAAMAPTRVELFPPLIGPVIEATEPFVLAHPEHGDRQLPGGEWYAVVYQRALANEVRRQLD